MIYLCGDFSFDVVDDMFIIELFMLLCEVDNCCVVLCVIRKVFSMLVLNIVCSWCVVMLVMFCVLVMMFVLLIMLCSVLKCFVVVLNSVIIFLLFDILFCIVSVWLFVCLISFIVFFVVCWLL